MPYHYMRKINEKWAVTALGKKKGNVLNQWDGKKTPNIYGLDIQGA